MKKRINKHGVVIVPIAPPTRLELVRRELHLSQEEFIARLNEEMGTYYGQGTYSWIERYAQWGASGIKLSETKKIEIFNAVKKIYKDETGRDLSPALRYFNLFEWASVGEVS